MFQSSKASRSANLLEQSLKEQADNQILSVKPSKREDIEQLRIQLSAAIDKLKQSKLGKGRRGKAALYALPWYMFIGPPAAGKTTAIENSGLEFPYGAKEIKGVGGTRNCDWFFSNSAILLDTAGRYMTEEDDKEEWLSFLQVLKKYRRHQPINGVIVGVSIKEITEVNLEKLEWHARNIRRRIDELMQQLGVRFPIYLVFTKCDLIQGFVDFFQDYNRVEREQIWGCTFSRDQLRTTEPRSIFESEYELLVKNIVTERFNRLSIPMKRENRYKVFVFPLELEAIRDKLSLFVSKLFQHNPYQDSPIFRGFYFTSGTQEGIPIDHAIESIAQQFNLPADVIGPFDPGMEKKSYFIKNLFTDVIIPDFSLVSNTSRASRQKNIMKLSTVAASLTFLTLFVLGVLFGYFQSKHELGRLRDSAKNVQQIDWNRANAFSTLDKLREQVYNLEHKRPFFLQMGMYRGKAVLPFATNLYYGKSRELVKLYIYDELQNRLLRSTHSREKLYSYLKTYLLLGEEYQRLDDKNNLNYLNSALDSLFLEFYPLTNVEGADVIRSTAHRQFNYFVSLTSEKKAQAFANDKLAISRARQAIDYVPSITNLYFQMKQEAQSQLNPVTLNEIIHGQSTQYLRSTFQVPGFFTKNGWQTYVKDTIERESKEPGKEEWVMASNRQILPAEMRNADNLAKELEKLYFDEYITIWWQFLQSVDYISFPNLSTASRVFQDLSDANESPIKLLIDYVSKETQFETKIPAALEEKGGKLLAKPLKKATSLLKGNQPDDMQETLLSGLKHPVDTRFAVLHELSSESEGHKDLLNILSYYTGISQTLESLQSDGSKAKDYAKNLIQSGSGQLADVLNAVGGYQLLLDTRTKEALFEQPIHLAWQAILGQTQSYLNQQWRVGVYDFFQKNLESYFPFNKQSNRDAAIEDFRFFFQPGDGYIWAFKSEELDPFINSQTFRPRTWQNRGIQVTSNFVHALQKAAEINRCMFPNNNLEVTFQFQIEDILKRSGTNRISPVISSVRLVLDNTESVYDMGHQKPEHYYTWPNEKIDPSVYLEVTVDRVPVKVRDYTGFWGWLKLLQNADSIAATPIQGRYKIQWILKKSDQYIIVFNYKLSTRSRYNPIDRPNELFMFNCPQSLN